MSSNNSESEIRDLSADHGASIGVLGYGVGFDDLDGGFTFTFE